MNWTQYKSNCRISVLPDMLSYKLKSLQNRKIIQLNLLKPMDLIE